MNDDETEALQDLCEWNETLHAHLKGDETDEGNYHMAVRLKPHPDVSGGVVLSERYGYLTKVEDGNDGWLSNGINRRVEDAEEAADMAQELAQMYAAVSARLRQGGETDPYTGDLTGEE